MLETDRAKRAEVKANVRDVGGLVAKGTVVLEAVTSSSVYERVPQPGSIRVVLGTSETGCLPPNPPYQGPKA